MNEFTQTLQSWQMFYATTATAAATLAGLLFVSLSINRSGLDERAKLYARTSFGNLTNVVALSLIFLIPHQQREALFIALLTFGAANLIATLVTAITGGKGSSTKVRTRLQVVALPIVLCFAVLVQALMINSEVRSAMYWPIAIIVMLLSSACRNAWDILFSDMAAQQKANPSIDRTPAMVASAEDVADH